MSHAKQEHHKHAGKTIIAGGIAGGIEICITFPTEYVKTQMQLYPTLAKNGSIWIVKETVKNHGWLGLYRGWAPLFYFAIPKNAVRFFAAEQARNYYRQKHGHVNSAHNFMSGLIGGIAEAIFVVTPQETMKVRLIHDQLSPNPKFKGFMHGVTTIIKEQGFAGTYKGLMPTILKQGSNQAIRFVSFYKLKEMMLGDPHKDFNRSTILGLTQSLVAGALAGAASVIGNTPIDVIKTKMQGLEAHNYKNAFDCVKKTWEADGFVGFFKGIGPRMGRVCLDVAICMTLFDYTMDLLNLVWVTDPTPPGHHPQAAKH